ncbi:hypothetical protein [Streptomyces venezuelae]|uniref:hypothetical protein n=1 Tax=Streptomyces venezuelae TaxID=54571 RepID=UPI00343CFF5B
MGDFFGEDQSMFRYAFHAATPAVAGAAKAAVPTPDIPTSAVPTSAVLAPDAFGGTRS